MSWKNKRKESRYNKKFSNENVKVSPIKELERESLIRLMSLSVISQVGG